MYFWTRGLWKTWLDKSLKSPVLDDASKSNMVVGAKHCWNLNNSTFTIFIDPWKGNRLGKSVSQRYGKSQHRLLTHWLPIRSILFLTEVSYCNIFRCNYLQKKKYFLPFFLRFRNLHSILNIFEKKATLIANVFFNLRTLKDVVR